MKLNQSPSLRVEDFPGQNWVGRLFVQLNPFIQAVNQVCNLNIDFVDNIKSISRSFEITTFQPFNFLWAWPEFPPTELSIVKSTKGTSQTPCILLAAWSYDAANASVSVSSMVEASTSGVAALSGRYAFTIRVTI